MSARRQTEKKIPVAALVAALALGTATLSRAAEKTEPKPEAKKPRTGAELYAINCARCHVERYAAERTEAQWKTIVLQMRVRTPLSAEDTKKILEYLKETH